MWFDNRTPRETQGCCINLDCREGWLGPGVRNKFEIAKKEITIAPEGLDERNFTLDQEGMLGRESSQSQEVHLIFLLTQVVTVSFPHGLMSDFIVLID